MSDFRPMAAAEEPLRPDGGGAMSHSGSMEAAP
jgi:hypothetical protein